MKFSFLAILLVSLISSCNGQQSAYKKAKEVQKGIEDAPRPGTIPTTANGWTMTAVIDGKKWTASSMMRPEVAGRVIGSASGNAYISLSNVERRYAQVGRKTIFREGKAVDFSVSGDSNIYGGYSGNMEITKVTDNWVEGIFHFTATSNGSTRKIEVTDGFFRIKVSE